LVQIERLSLNLGAKELPAKHNDQMIQFQVIADITDELRVSTLLAEHQQQATDARRTSLQDLPQDNFKLHVCVCVPSSQELGTPEIYRVFSFLFFPSGFFDKPHARNTQQILLKFSEVIAVVLVHGISYFEIATMLHNFILFEGSISVIIIRFEKFLLQSIQHDYSYKNYPSFPIYVSYLRPSGTKVEKVERKSGFTEIILAHDLLANMIIYKENLANHWGYKKYSFTKLLRCSTKKFYLEDLSKHGKFREFSEIHNKTAN
jgi:hypothetical protein